MPVAAVGAGVGGDALDAAGAELAGGAVGGTAGAVPLLAVAGALAGEVHCRFRVARMATRASTAPIARYVTGGPA
jgi:hypothetical protein